MMIKIELEERSKLMQRIESFRQKTGTKYELMPTLITTYGLKRNTHPDFFRGMVVTMQELIRR